MYAKLNVLSLYPWYIWILQLKITVRLILSGSGRKYLCLSTAFLKGQNGKDLSFKIQTFIHCSMHQGFINHNTAILTAQSGFFLGRYLCVLTKTST
jgi:hypothetical protein